MIKERNKSSVMYTFCTLLLIIILEYRRKKERGLGRMFLKKIWFSKLI